MEQLLFLHLVPQYFPLHERKKTSINLLEHIYKVSRLLIGLFSLSISVQTDEFIIYTVLVDVKNELKSVFHVSVVLLTVNFVITLSE